MSLPESGFRPLKTAADYRLALHTLTAAAVPILVLFGVNEATYLGWVALGFSAFDALVAFSNTYDGLRKFIYSAGGIAQSALLAIGVASDAPVLLGIGAAVTFLTAVVAVFYTPNSAVTSE